MDLSLEQSFSKEVCSGAGGGGFFCVLPTTWRALESLEEDQVLKRRIDISSKEFPCLIPVDSNDK